jgi:hypothetical protein
MDDYQRRDALVDALGTLCYAFYEVEHIKPRPVVLYGHVVSAVEMAKEELRKLGCEVYYSEQFHKWMATGIPKGVDKNNG